MLKNSLLKCFANNSYKGLNLNTIYKVPIKTNFDQFKEKPKRHFMIFYKYVEDMNYKRSKNQVNQKSF